MRRSPFSPWAPVATLAGALVVAMAWILPVNFKSIDPVLLAAAGSGTPTVGSLGRDMVDSEKIGPASIILTAARAIADPRTAALERALSGLAEKEPAAGAWGGWDPALEPIFHLHGAARAKGSVPVLSFLVPEDARIAAASWLSHSGSPGAREVLQTRQVASTGRFVPATRPGGQPLDALVVLTALLYQSDRLSGSLQREVRSLALEANRRNDLGDLEAFYSDLLSLGRRLDWTQLCELLRRTQTVRTVGEYAQLARVAPDAFPLLYTAALLTDSPDGVASYLLNFGSAGAQDLRRSLALGGGAVRLLIDRQLPLKTEAGSSPGSIAETALLHPRLLLVLKYAGYILGVFLMLQGLERWMVPTEKRSPRAAVLEGLRVGTLSLLFAALLVIASEPFLLQASSLSDYAAQLHLPVLLSSVTAPPAQSSNPASPTMDTSTVVSIGVFAVLQVVMYMLCVRKIADIDRMDLPPAMKLKLVENEENLFDSGLYVGMMGTASALVLMVLHVIDQNLLAAYSSNLFGIVCVAFVKIGHVRGFKRSLILQSQGAAPAAAPAATR